VSHRLPLFRSGGQRDVPKWCWMGLPRPGPRALPKNEIDRLAPHLSPLQFKQNDSLAASGEREPYGCFLDEGMASIVTTLTNGNTLDVGAVGQDWVVGVGTIYPALTIVLRSSKGAI
jgi:hypothetical protein